MKFAVVVVLALCHVAFLKAQVGFQCGASCTLDGNWRTINNALYSDDDEIIWQQPDGQVEWREEYLEFKVDLDRYVNRPSGTSSSETSRLQQVARESCKEAIPDRIYNFRYEREIDGDRTDQNEADYDVNFYIYAGYKISERNWDKYCDLLMNTYLGDGGSGNLFSMTRASLFVPTSGEDKIKTLKGAWQRRAVGTMVQEGISSTTSCNVRFLARELTQACMMKNNKNRFPTEIFCADAQSNGLKSPYAVPGLDVSAVTNEHAYGGAHTYVRYGCQQDTWDSDTNDDNIFELNAGGDVDRTGNCKQMYFVNNYDGQSTFKFGVIPGAATGTTYLNTLVTVDSIVPYCEVKVNKLGWKNLAHVQNHRCQ